MCAPSKAERREDSCFRALVDTAIVLHRSFGDEQTRAFLARMGAAEDIITRVLSKTNLRPLKALQN